MAQAFDQAWINFAEWGVPYALGRIYYADLEGSRRLAISIVVAALLYVPFCAFEMILGGDWFLKPLIFDNHEIPPAFRLGGWKPMVMMTGGNELMAWMALATVLATWLAASRERWRGKFLPPWLPPTLLLVTTIAGRGAYAYVTLALGLSGVVALLLTRRRWVLAPLLLLPAVYIFLRVSGIWDGQAMVRLAALTGERAIGSIWIRVGAAENDHIREAFAHNILFGLGGRYESSWADGWWLSMLTRGGLLAVVAHFSAFLLPAGLAIFRRSSRPPIASAEMGLALFVVLQAIDSLHNIPLIAPTTLAGGVLAASFLRRSGEKGPDRATPRPAPSPAHRTYRLHDITSSAPSTIVDLGQVRFVLTVACLFYVFGHAQVAGQEGMKFVGGLGSALLFSSVGAVIAIQDRRSMPRVLAFGLAFALLGISFNLALHPGSAPVWSADILQGLAFTGLVAAAWRRIAGGGPWTSTALVLLAAGWWAAEPYSQPFSGSQYLFASNGDRLSVFPVLPWLAMTALGGLLVRMPPLACLALACGFGLAALAGWNQGPPFGPPIKFPLNFTYTMLGASLASTSFALWEIARRWEPARAASGWLGRRWLVFSTSTSGSPYSWPGWD